MFKQIDEQEVDTYFLSQGCGFLCLNASLWTRSDYVIVHTTKGYFFVNGNKNLEHDSFGAKLNKAVEDVIGQLIYDDRF